MAGGDQELTEVAKAVAVMANAGAHVFVIIWNEDKDGLVRELVTSEAIAQGIDPASLNYSLLPASKGGRAILDSMRGVLNGVVAWPAQYPPDVDAPLIRVGQVVHDSADWGAGHGLAAESTAGPIVNAPVYEQSNFVAAVEPTQTPIRVVRPLVPAPVVQPVAPTPVTRTPGSASGTTQAAAQSQGGELLSRPPLPGQVTLTVTSSKGGSGKSTTAMLLAGAIAKSSTAAGRPLKVVLIDMDTRDGQVASLIGTYMPTALNIRVQPVWDESTILRHLVHDDLLGIDCLLAPIRPRTADTVGPDFYKVIIRSLQRTHDVVVIDTSVQYLDPLIAQVCLPEATAILFVTTLATTAVQGMARAMREITTPVEESGMGISRSKIGIVVNQSVADVGMEKDQVLAAGLGVPVVGVIPLATKDVLTATNLNRMSALLEHPLLGPAYFNLAKACLPNADLAPVFKRKALDNQQAAFGSDPMSQSLQPEVAPVKKKGSLFRR
jgi:cellulose biosynthesis protein BcsQ